MNIFTLGLLIISGIVVIPLAVVVFASWLNGRTKYTGALIIQEPKDCGKVDMLNSEGGTWSDGFSHWADKTPTEIVSEPKDTSVSDMLRIVIGMMIYNVIASLFDVDERGIWTFDTIWITSPSGHTTIELPYYDGMRIIRKQHWRLATVEPVRIVSRFEALKILIRGDRRYNGEPGRKRSYLRRMP